MVDVVDAATLDAELDAAWEALPAEHVEHAAAMGEPEFFDALAWAVVHWRVWDDERRARVAMRQNGGAWSPRREPVTLDGDVAAWGVTTLRPVR